MERNPAIQKDPVKRRSMQTKSGESQSNVGQAALRVQGLGKTVSDVNGPLSILGDVNFSLPQAQTVAIVGASGSGKSTLLSLLAGLDTPSAGQVWVQGQDLFALDEDARAAFRARHMGFVFQNFQLLTHLSALENVMLPLELAGVTGAQARARAMLERVGLGERLQHKPRVLSGGEQQRVALARAFVVEPQLLLADEPTGSLDFATGDVIMTLMLELNREFGTTLVLVTHDDKLAERCQRQLTIAAGRLANDSAPIMAT
jgi:putative ABC transport system ATP-binding protein